MNPINFTGSYLRTAYIPHKKDTGEIEQTQVSIVELNPKDAKDVEALGRTSVKWEHIKSGFAMNIFNELFKPRLYPDVNYEKYLALTTQNENYSKLDHEKILGLALYSDRRAPQNEISWLQACPTTNYESDNEREYSGIGSTLTKYIKEISDKPLYVQADYNAIAFYEKQGFKSVDPEHPSIMLYEV